MTKPKFHSIINRGIWGIDLKQFENFENKMMEIFNKLKKLFFRKNKDILKKDVEIEVGTNNLVLCDRETGNKVHIVCQKINN